MLFPIGFMLTWAALFAAPIVAAVQASANWRADEWSGLSRVSLGAAALIAVVALSWWIGLQTSSPAANFALCLAAFAAYWMLAAAAWGVRPRVVGALLGIVAWVPLLPTLVLGTVGVLGLSFVLGDYLSPPREARWLTPGLYCRVTLWGAVFSDEGYTVHLYRSLPWFPLVRLETATVRVTETNPEPGADHTTCESAAGLRPEGPPVVRQMPSHSSPPGSSPAA